MILGLHVNKNDKFKPEGNRLPNSAREDIKQDAQINVIFKLPPSFRKRCQPPSFEYTRGA